VKPCDLAFVCKVQLCISMLHACIPKHMEVLVVYMGCDIMIIHQTHLMLQYLTEYIALLIPPLRIRSIIMKKIHLHLSKL